jgi:flagellar hook-basal body complex protein FliE
MAVSNRPSVDRRSDSRDSRSDTRSGSFGKHDFGGSSVARPGVDGVRFEEFKKHLDTLNTKVDKILMALESESFFDSAKKTADQTLGQLVDTAHAVEKKAAKTLKKVIAETEDVVEDAMRAANKKAKPAIAAATKSIKKVVANVAQKVEKAATKVVAKSTKEPKVAKAKAPAKKPAAKVAKKK